ncbi:MAG: hypothetical protein KAI02_05145 [Gammaproteobacteria bacterium]|nr:hypothetical protein [Gammaproteobacteria bacterium]
MNNKTSDKTLEFNNAVEHCLSLLEKLNIQQKHVSNDFVVNDYLHYFDMLDYQQSIQSDTLLCRYAAELFGYDYNHLTVTHKRNITGHCAEISFTTHEQDIKTFYIKEAWEGAIKEGIGLEFNNLLTDTKIRYLCSSEIIITEKIFEALSQRQLHVLRDTKDYLFAFGVWEVFTKLLHLTDRKTTNIRWNGQRLANIDFGLVFYRGKLVFDSRFTIKEMNESREAGNIYALNWVLDKLKQGKVQELLLNIDSQFCRQLVCHRNPIPPLRQMILVLQEGIC